MYCIIVALFKLLLHKKYDYIRYNMQNDYKGNTMKQTYEVLNVKCGGCANTLKTKLVEEFGEIEVNLDVEPRQITLDIEASAVPLLRENLKSLGYPMSDEDLSTFEGFSTTAKSFISCAVGKMNT